MVIYGDTRTPWVLVKSGVPQGSVHGPLLYLLYAAKIPAMFSKYLATGHLYADDVQVLVLGSPSDQLTLTDHICNSCICNSCICNSGICNSCIWTIGYQCYQIFMLLENELPMSFLSCKYLITLHK